MASALGLKTVEHIFFLKQGAAVSHHEYEAYGDDMSDNKSQYKLELYLSIQFRYQLQLGGKGPGSAGGQLSLSGAEESTETEDSG